MTVRSVRVVDLRHPSQFVCNIDRVRASLTVCGSTCIIWNHFSAYACLWMTLQGWSSTLRPACISPLDEEENVLQGVNPSEAVDDEGILGGANLDYILFAQYPFVDAPSPAPTEYPSTDYGDLAFISEDWLAKARQVHSSFPVRHVFLCYSYDLTFSRRSFLSRHQGIRSEFIAFVLHSMAVLFTRRCSCFS
jgi:hypothetical protein